MFFRTLKIKTRSLALHIDRTDYYSFIAAYYLANKVSKIKLKILTDINWSYKNSFIVSISKVCFFEKYKKKKFCSSVFKRNKTILKKYFDV